MIRAFTQVDTSSLHLETRLDWKNQTDPETKCGYQSP